LKVELDYVARDVFKSYHSRKERWAVIVAHRRAGKTVACVIDLIDHCLRCPLERPRVAYIAPYYKQAKSVAWDYVKNFSRQIPGAVINESDLRVDYPNGGRIKLYGADDPDALRGMYFDAVVLDEYADMRPRFFPEVLRPALADRKGLATFIGTTRTGTAGCYERRRLALSIRTNWCPLARQ
jgi:phage terminase large subunit